MEDLDYLFLTPLANSEVPEPPQFAFAGIDLLESRLNILRAAISVTCLEHRCFQAHHKFNQQSQIPGLPLSSTEDLVVFACSPSQNITVFKREIEKILYPNASSSLLSIMPDMTQSEFFTGPGSF